MPEPDAYVAQWLKQADPDRYVACLLAPEAKQADLMALYAFNAEIAATRERTREPLAGEMRLEWWREALSGAGRGAESNPLFGALSQVLQRQALPTAPLLALVEARRHDLYDDLFVSLDDLVDYCDATCASLLRLSGHILADGRDPGGRAAFDHGGVAYALTGLLRAFPYHVRAGRLMWPQQLLDRHGLSRAAIVSGHAEPGLKAAWEEMVALADEHMQKARAALKEVMPAARPALLPLALVPAELHQLRRRTDPFALTPPTPRWRVLWRLWRGSKRFS